MIGVGYRRELAKWINGKPFGVDCLELTAEHFSGRDDERLRALREHYTLFVHGLGLSLGTPGALDPRRLEHFRTVADAANADWVSEHIAFTRTAEADLGHLNSLRPTNENVTIIADHAKDLADHCGRPVILENITSHLRLEGELSEPDFLNAICAKGDCGLLLDVTNLYINSRNHSFDAMAWLDALDSSRIRQLHIVGYSYADGRYQDDHAQPIQPDLLDLAREVIARAPVKAVILERDEAIPDAAAMESEIAKLHTLP